MSLTLRPQASSWSAIKHIISAAVFAGLIAGLCLTALQLWQVRPLIRQAEVAENAKAALAHGQSDQQVEGHQHAHADVHTHTHEPAHADASPMGSTSSDHQAAPHDSVAADQPVAAEWHPADGTERLLYTTLANVSLAIGFGLLLAAAIFLRGSKPGWLAGLGWGVAAYIVFFVAPSIGLPPELPGTEAAPLAARQLWWISTVSASAVGLALLCFARLPWKMLGVVALLVPVFVGAPQAPIAEGGVPIALAHAFVMATALANGIFWLVLGPLIAYCMKRST